MRQLSLIVVVFALTCGIAYSGNASGSNLSIAGPDSNAISLALETMSASPSSIASGALSISSSNPSVVFMQNSILGKNATICGAENAYLLCPVSALVYMNSSNTLQYVGVLSEKNMSKAASAENEAMFPQALPATPEQAPFSLPPEWPIWASVLVVAGLTVHYLLNRRP